MKFFSVIVLLVFCNACSSVTPKLDEARKTYVTTSLFKENLRSGYIELADEQWKQGDKKDAQIYADKALHLIKSDSYTPSVDPLVGRKLSIQKLDMLSEEKNFITSTLSSDFPDEHPIIAANAQLAFDCWVENEEERRHKNNFSKCKHRYFIQKDEIMSILDQKVQANEQQEILKKKQISQQQQQQRLQYERLLVSMQNQNQAPKTEEKVEFWNTANGAKAGSYIIFFDLNSDKLNKSAEEIISKIVDHTYSANPAKIVISGHADLSGSNDFNMKLSHKRAESIARALKTSGISEDILDIRSYGENSPNILTKDEVTESKNRYAKIYFLKDNKVYY